MKNSVLDRLKSYFDEYFQDATKPTAKNLFLIIVSILALDIFRSVRFAHRHVLSKLSDTLLNAYYYALKTDKLGHAPWRDVTVSKALKAMPRIMALIIWTDTVWLASCCHSQFWQTAPYVTFLSRLATSFGTKNRQSWGLSLGWYARPWTASGRTGRCSCSAAAGIQKGALQALWMSAIPLTSSAMPGLTLPCMTSRLDAQKNGAAQKNMGNVVTRGL